MPNQNDICPTCGNTQVMAVENCLYCESCGTLQPSLGPAIVPYLVRACRCFYKNKISETVFNDVLILCTVPPQETPKESETTDGH